MSKMLDHGAINHTAPTSAHGDHLSTASVNARAVPRIPKTRLCQTIEPTRSQRIADCAGWSRSIEGMSTLVRVLAPEMFEKIRSMQKKARVPSERAEPSTYKH
jgi:hypothetical protein